MNDNFKAFTQATGITVAFTGSKGFEADITAQIAAGSAPDIIDFPQPGLLAGFVKQGKIVDSAKLVPIDFLKKNYLQSWLDMSTIAGSKRTTRQGGGLNRLCGKLLVWYSKKQID